MNQAEKKEKIRFGVRVLAAVVLTFLLCSSQVLYSFDKMFADRLYQTPSVTDNRIKIIGIDERTIQEYGNITEWSREIPARLVEVLNADAQNAPLVIGFDILYVTEGETEADVQFARACKEAGNVVTAVNVVTKDKLTLDENGSLTVDELYAQMVEYPYEGLKEAVSYGFANTTQDRDGYIRYALWSMDYEGEQILSFPAKIYEEYCTRQGIVCQIPALLENNVFGFTFSGKSGDYEYFSLCDVLEGKVDARVFQDSIVLVGAYAPGMQDAYNVAVQKGSQMYGVEIHANILEALMEGKVYLPLSAVIYGLAAALFVLVFVFVSKKGRLLPTTICMAGMILLSVVTGKILYGMGIAVPVVEIPLLLLICYIYQLITGYLGEFLKRRKVMNAFKKYVAPQVVEEITKQGDFEMVLGGENRNIAVLFVDIRGFTPMSESLEPEQVVEILNEYLSLTTQAIFKNGGTLDKFIGDATMAVFNAPFDLEDYIYKAVCTAIDIAAGSDELEKKLMERFGKSVSFGIGVNCGPAVVGNIGCEFRMDYTAIGDTVNTAARLESNAKRGQILISKAVYEAVQDRIDATELGVIPLKGKKDGALVFEVHGIKE